MMDEGVLLEAFRGAAMGMRSWTSALDLVAGAARARIGQIAAMSAEGAMTFNLLSGTSPDEEAAYWEVGGPDPARNPRTRGLLAAPPLVAIVDDDYVSRELRDRTPIYRTLFAQSDVPSSLQIRTITPGGGTIALCLQRPGSSGEADMRERRFIEALFPGVADAVIAAQAMGLESDRGTLATAEHLAGPAMLLGADLTVVSLSPTAEVMVRDGGVLAVRNGRLRARGAGGQARLDHGFAAVAHAPVALRRMTRVMLDAADGTIVAVDLCPLPVRISGPMSLAQVLLVVRQPSAVEDSQVIAALRAGFGLTAAEASVAMLVADGLSIAAVAARRGAAIGTVRAQLKMVFEKTGCRRQAELVLKLGTYRRQ